MLPGEKPFPLHRIPSEQLEISGWLDALRLLFASLAA